MKNEFSEDNKAAELEELRELTARFTPCSLTPIQEITLAKMLLKNPMQTGEDMFALMAWAVPARAKELLLMRWNDILPIPGANDGASVAIRGDEHSAKNGGALRMALIAGGAYELLLKRKQGIVNYYNKLMENEADKASAHVDINEFPICCSGNNYADCGNIENMVKRCRELLLTAGVSKDSLRLMELTIKHCDDPTVQNEDSAETYLLRRNFATRALIAGLTKAEICYLMGIPND